MLLHRSARAGAAAAVVAAGLLVGGCGLLPSPSMPPVPTAEPAPSGSADGDQSAQCAQLMAEVSSIAADVAQIGTTLATDPLRALTLLPSITDRIGGLQTRVTDPALLERIGEIQSGWDALVADAQESISTGDTAAFERIGGGLTELADRVTSLQEFCAGTA